MAGYPYTSQVEDSPTRKSLIAAFDQLTKAQSDLATLIARVDTLETPAPAAPSTTTIVSTGGGGGGGGPAFGSFGPGDLIAVDSASTLIGLPDVIAGNVLLSGGINTLPSWGKLQLATHVIGTLAVNHGGTGLTTYAVGDLLYASGAAALSRLADVAAGSYLRSGGVGAAPVWSTPTLPNSATTGDLLYASAANVYSNLADVATGNALISGGVGAAPSWGKIGLTTHVSGDLPFSSFVQASAASKLVGRGSASGAGDFEEITLGTGLTMTGTTLSASGGAPGGSNTQVQFNNSGAFGGDADLTFVTDTLTATKLVAPTSVSTPSIITASGALTVTPAAGSNLNIALSTTGDFAVNTSQLYVDTSAAKVGIGTTSPTGIFQVGGSTNTDYPFYVTQGSSAGAFTGSYEVEIRTFAQAALHGMLICHNEGTAGRRILDLANSSGVVVQVDGLGKILGPSGSASAPTFSANTDANTGMYFDGADALKFSTNGTLRLNISSTGIHTMSAYGAGTATFDAAGVISSTSDERLKDIQGSYTGGLPEVLHLDPIRFRYRPESGMETSRTYIGFSAQNVMRVIPGAVGKSPLGYYSLNDRGILAALVNSVKTLQEEIAILAAALGQPLPDLTPIYHEGEDGIILPVLEDLHG